ncbi:hypothetical protein JXA40_08050 [bacterium]|nr:hypothetical protein [candidate division CSSED10-310 bacterium]
MYLFHRAADLVRAEHNRCPAARPQDYYKLLFQSALGMEHRLIDPVHLASRIREEYSGISPDPGQPAFIDITLHQPLYRVNLARLKHEGISPDFISDACLSGMKRFVPLRDIPFNRVMIHLQTILVSDPFGLPPGCILSILRDSARKPVHHSECYRRTYRPHYVLLPPEELARLSKRVGVPHDGHTGETDTIPDG